MTPGQKIAEQAFDAYAEWCDINSEALAGLDELERVKAYAAARHDKHWESAWAAQYERSKRLTACMAAFCDAAERIALEMTPPNPHTSQLLSLVILYRTVVGRTMTDAASPALSVESEL